MQYFFHLLIYFQIYCIVAMSLNLLVGYCGLLTLAHAGFFAIGAYGYAVIRTTTELDFVSTIIIGMIISATCSLVLSLFSWRLKGDFFVLASLAVQALIYTMIYNWADTAAPIGSLLNMTNGPFGITNIPGPSMFGVTFEEPSRFLIVSTFAAASCFLVLRTLQNAGWTQALFAMRDDELAARGLGKNTRLLKVQAVAIAASFAAAAGALYASYVGFIDPTSASLDEGILMLCMVLVGGLGSLRGSIAGAAVLIALPEVLRLLNLADAQAANIRLCVYGMALVAMMRFRPQGIAGTYRIE